MQATFFEAGGTVVKIGSSLKSNHEPYAILACPNLWNALELNNCIYFLNKITQNGGKIELFLNQVSLSSLKWPSSLYWAKLGEKYQVKYDGKNVTYARNLNYTLGINNLNVSDLVLDVYTSRIEEFIYNNFLQVKKKSKFSLQWHFCNQFTIQHS